MVCFRSQLFCCKFWLFAACRKQTKKKTTVYDRFHGNGPYGKIPTCHIIITNDSPLSRLTLLASALNQKTRKETPFVGTGGRKVPTECLCQFATRFNFNE